jgi:hypothetical protein
MMGTVLRVDMANSPPPSSFYDRSYQITGLLPPPCMAVWALVDNIHSSIPLPKTILGEEVDHRGIESFSAFYCVQDTFPPPKIGSFVWVDFKDRINWTDGIYLGPVDEIPSGQLVLDSDSPLSSRSVFESLSEEFNLGAFNQGTAANDLERKSFSSRENKQAAKKYGAFSYRSSAKGAIIIDKTWSRENIKIFTLHTGKRIQFHKDEGERFVKTFKEAVDASGYEPKRIGTWVPRHVTWSPEKPLSLHSWGVAVDFDNAKPYRGAPPDSWNEYGRKDTLIRKYPKFYETFERNGWVWGGRWSGQTTVDDQHFQVSLLRK